ncbi:MAG: S1C family serine protease [Parcubacteria group bacterium]
MQARISPTSPSHPERAHNTTPPSKAWNNNSRMMYVALSLVIGFFAGLVGIIIVLRWEGLWYRFGLVPPSTLTDSIGGIVRSLSSEEATIQQVESRLREKVSPVLIGLYRSDARTNIGDDILSPEGFVAWGILMTNDGVFVTIQDALPPGDLIAKMQNGQTYPVTLKSSDAVHGLQYASVELQQSSVADLTDTQGYIIPGQSVYTLEVNLLGRPGSMVRHPIVSKEGLPGTSREIIHSSEDAAASLILGSPTVYVAPGTPIADRGGKIVGMARAVGPEGITAVTSDTIADSLRSFLENDAVVYPYLGLRYIDLSEDPSFASVFDVNEQIGAYVYGGTEPAVISGSPSAVGGIQEGDIITHVGSETLTTSVSLADALRSITTSNGEIALSLRRGADTQKIKVTLEFR